MDKEEVKILLVIAIIYLFFDFIFIYLLNMDMWNNQIELIQNGEKPVYRPSMGIAVYIIMVLCTYYLVVKRHASKSVLDYREIIFHGALLGLAFYGVFDGTNYVIFKDYKIETLLTDGIYGVIITTFASLCGTLLATR